MKTYAAETQRLLKSALSIPVFADNVPEASALPALAWVNMSQSASRVVSGVKTPATVYHRLYLLVKAGEMSKIDPIAAALATLDNSSNADFQRIQLSLENIEPLQPESPLFRVIFELTLTTR